MSVPETTIAQLHRDRLAIEQKMAEEESRHTSTMADLRRTLRDTKRLINEHAAGLDHDKIAQAEHLLLIRGSYANGGAERESVVDDAIDALVTSGGARMRDQFLGTKNYDRWRGQRSDHPYGFGPRHGSICFAIGLTPEVRDLMWNDSPLTDDEIEAATYYLTNIAAIDGAKAKALA